MLKNILRLFYTLADRLYLLIEKYFPNKSTTSCPLLTELLFNDIKFGKSCIIYYYLLLFFLFKKHPEFLQIDSMSV